MSVPEWCLAWLLELPRCYLCSQGTKGSAHPSGLEQARPGAVPALGRGFSPSLPAQPCQEQQAGSSSQHCLPFLTSLPEQRLRVPPPRSLGALQETRSSSPVHSRLLFKLSPPSSGVGGKPSPGAGGSGGSCSVPVPCASRAIPDFEQGLDGALGPSWHSLPQPSPSSSTSGSLPLLGQGGHCWWPEPGWPRVALRSRGSRAEQQLCSVPSSRWVTSARAGAQGQTCSAAVNAR